MLKLIAVVLAAAVTGGHVPGGAQNRVGGVNTGAQAFTRVSAPANPDIAWKIYDAAPELAADALLAAGGAGQPAEQGWKLGAFKSAAKWESQMAKRGWSPQQISEAMQKGERFGAENLVNKGNAATRYVHPETGRPVVVDDVTKEVIHVGGDAFKY